MAAAPDISLTKQMEELLTCCICDETLKEPRTLGCFHSFCKKCLAEYVESQRKKIKKGHKHVFDCPLCRIQFQLKQGENVDQIRPCFFINNLLEMLHILNRASEQACESCKGKVPVVSRCIECENYLCEKCLTAHNNWPPFSEHELLSLAELAKPENMGKAKARPRCKKEGHGNKVLEIYCKTCKELACLTCVVLDHPKPEHECQPIGVVAKQQKEALKATLNTLQKMSDDGQGTLNNIKQTSQNLQKSNLRAKEVILQQEKELLEAFSEKLKYTTAALIVEVERKHNEISEKLSKQHDSMKVYVEKVNGSLKFVKNIIEKGSNEDILSLGNEIKENPTKIEQKCPKMTSSFESGYFNYQQTKSAKTVVDKVDLKELGKVGKFAFSVIHCSFCACKPTI